MLDALKSLKLWQKVVLIAVLIGIAGGVYGIYAGISGPKTETLSEDIQLVPVQYGNLENSVSVSGSVVFSIREQLTFGSTGTVQEVNVEEGDAVREGQVLAKLDEISMISLQKAVVQAKINLQDEEDIAQAEATVANARVALKTAEENLEKAENPYTASDIAQAELAVVNAKINLKAAQEAFVQAKGKYEGNPTVPEWRLDYEQKREQLATAEGNLADAEDTLAEMKAGADSLQVEQKQKELAIAQYNLTKAESELAGLQGRTESLEAELRQLEVAEAQAALDKAVERLEAATMVAPFEGIIASVNVEASDEVAASKVVIELVDPSAVEVSAILDEIDVSEVAQGQKVTISLDALPDLELEGEVSSIATVAQAQAGIVSYPIGIDVTLPAGINLREGMSATANIVVQEVNNALLIPNQAIGGTTNNPMVNVMVNDEIQQRAVRLGISDGTWTEVIEGLQETDLVVMSTSTVAGTTRQDFPRGLGMPGGMMIIR